MAEFIFNVIPIIAGTIGAMVVGALWYSPHLFGEEWAHLIGIKMKDMKGMDMSMMIIPGVSALLMSTILYNFITWSGGVTLPNALIVAFLVWIGFIATALFVNNSFAGRPKKLWYIDAGHYLIALLVMGAAIGLLG